jgi:predicted transcriptional regulator
MQMPPVIELFRSNTRRKLIEFALTEMDDQQVQTRELIEGTDLSRKSVTSQLHGERAGNGPLILFGVLDPNHDPIEDDPNIAFFTLADTPVTQLLAEWDGYPLVELFGTSGAQKLVRFFIMEADPDEYYSVTDLREQDSLGYEAATNYIEWLVEAGLAETTETARTTKYRVDTDSELYTFLRRLNDALVDTYNERLERFVN